MIDPDWLTLAKGAFDHICAVNADLQGRLNHSRRLAQSRHPASLDDYAQMISAGLALHQANGDSHILTQVLEWLSALDAHFWDMENGGYYFSADDIDDVIVRRREAYDEATPSGNSTMVTNFVRLWLLTGETAYAERAHSIVRTFASGLEKQYFSHCGLINASALLEAGQLVVIIGTPDQPDTAKLIRAAHTAFAPLKTVQILSDTAGLPSGHPAAGKSMIGGNATAYVCAAMTCSPPVTDPGELTSILAQPPLVGSING